jgi:hypothetical protein
MSVPRYYAGIGSRETPETDLELLRRIARQLAADGWVLRSGGAPGADTACESGAADAGDDSEIYLPWAGFNGHGEGIVASALPSLRRALDVAEPFHPAWDRLKQPVRLLMARNVMQVLGADLSSPSRFVVCWASGSRFDGGRIVDVAGGTGMAVRLAAAHGIAVFNIALDVHKARLETWLDSAAVQAPSPSL